MGKRSDFERKPNDYYPTPPTALVPLLPHLHDRTKFVEPCAGDGRLIDYLELFDHTCTFACDMEPRRADIVQMDAFDLSEKDCAGANYIITNPPWSRDILHPLILRFVSLRPTWLLFDADWLYTKQAKAYMEYCVAVVAVGRVKWIEGSTNTGKDNCAWYLFSTGKQNETRFYAR